MYDHLSLQGQQNNVNFGFFNVYFIEQKACHFQFHSVVIFRSAIYECFRAVIQHRTWDFEIYCGFFGCFSFCIGEQIIRSPLNQSTATKTKLMGLSLF